MSRKVCGGVRTVSTKFFVCVCVRVCVLVSACVRAWVMLAVLTSWVCCKGLLKVPLILLRHPHWGWAQGVMPEVGTTPRAKAWEPDV